MCTYIGEKRIFDFWISWKWLLRWCFKYPRIHAFNHHITRQINIIYIDSLLYLILKFYSKCINDFYGNLLSQKGSSSNSSIAVSCIVLLVNFGLEAFLGFFYSHDYHLKHITGQFSMYVVFPLIYIVFHLEFFLFFSIIKYNLYNFGSCTI